MALFMGASLSQKYHQEPVAKVNRAIINEISKQVANYNRNFFRVKLRE